MIDSPEHWTQQMSMHIDQYNALLKERDTLRARVALLERVYEAAKIVRDARDYGDCLEPDEMDAVADAVDACKDALAAVEAGGAPEHRPDTVRYRGKIKDKQRWRFDPADHDEDGGE